MHSVWKWLASRRRSFTASPILCNNCFACWVLLERNTILSVKLLSAKVTAECDLLYLCVILTPVPSLQMFVAILKAQYSPIMNKNGICVSPCNMLVSISKNSVSPSSDETSGKIIKYSYCFSYAKNIRESLLVRENCSVLQN